MLKPKPWTAAENERALELFNAGKTCVEIAVEFNMNYDTVKKRVKRLRNPPEPRRYREWTLDKIEVMQECASRGLVMKQAAHEIGVTYKALRAAAVRYKVEFKRNPSPNKHFQTGFLWPDENVELLKQRVAEGKSSGQIATELGLGRGAVTSKIKRLGLQVHKRPRAQHVSGRGMIETIRRLSRPPQEPPGSIFGLDVINLAPTQCRWTFDTEGGTRRVYCREEQIDEQHPYCYEHAQRVYAAHGAGSEPLAEGEQYINRARSSDIQHAGHGHVQPAAGSKRLRYRRYS